MRHSSQAARTNLGARTDSAALLGGLPVAQFLARFWHKQALLVRAAAVLAHKTIGVNELLRLAQRDDVESRLVLRQKAGWTLTHGPFRARDLKSLPERNWTLLVQGVNLHSAAGDALLRRFSFLPYARLDDLMVSYATPGGGVGPHYDSYDVFLLQGVGRRRWRYGRQSDLTLQPDLPLEILVRFTPEHDHVLMPGDMLYLPPQFAHDGVALDACTTYSIGLRAPAFNELATAFVDFLRDQLDLPGRYADPDLAPTRHPAKIDRAMQRQCARALKGIRWSSKTIERFLGCWLSEPKPSVFFERPPRPLTMKAFAKKSGERGVRLNPRTQLLYDADHLFVNGSEMPLPAVGADVLRRLADRRALSSSDAAALPASVLLLLHNWYCDGFLCPSE